MLCLFQPLVCERYGFCQAGCRIESLEYLISIVDMCHKCIEQLLLCFKKRICIKIYAVIFLKWCMIDLIMFSENILECLCYSMQRYRINTERMTQIMISMLKSYIRERTQTIECFRMEITTLSNSI